MLVFCGAVLLLALMSGLPSTHSTGAGNGKLPDNFFGIFRNDSDKENHTRALSSVVELPRSVLETEGNFIHFQLADTADTYEYCPLNTGFTFYREMFETFMSCIPFKLGERRHDDHNGEKMEVMFNMTDDPTVLKGSITNAQKGSLQLQFTVSEKGVELLSIYRNHGDQETITTKAFYQRTMQRYILGMFEVDTERVTQETIDKINTMFRPINYGGLFSFSLDTRFWVREPYEGVFRFATLFSAAHQWFSSFALSTNFTLYHDLFNGTTEARYWLEKSTATESVLLCQMVSSNGRFNLTTRTLFKPDAVEETRTLNGEQVTMHYRRIVEDLFYGSYEEVTESGKEGLSANLKMACPGTKSGARVNISPNVDRMYSFDITPCGGADPVHIPFVLNNLTGFTSKQQNNETAKAYFYIGEWNALHAKLYDFVRPKGTVLVRIARDAPYAWASDSVAGILLSVLDSETFQFRSYKFRRVFPSHMFDSFESTNDTSNMTKRVLEFSQNDNGSFVSKLSAGREKSVTTKFEDIFWTDLNTGEWGIYYYFEFAGDGVPAILRVQHTDDSLFRWVWTETMIFKPDGVEVHTSILAKNSHKKQFYSRKPSVKK